MNNSIVDWDDDLPLTFEDAYRALVRSLTRSNGFGLLFARCSPVQTDRVAEKLRSDFPQKKIILLEITEEIENLYDRIAELPDRDQIGILLVKGLEYSFFGYEDREAQGLERSRSPVYGGNWKSVPRLMGNLNLSRERFRDNFSFCIVFFLPEFALRYFIRRAPDFFDWRSNVYDFPTEQKTVHQEATRIIEEGTWEKYRSLSPQERICKLSDIRAYLTENPDPDVAAKLWFEKGFLHSVTEEYEEAIASYDREHPRMELSRNT